LEDCKDEIEQVEDNVDGQQSVNNMAMDFAHSNSQEESSDSNPGQRRAKDVDKLAIIPTDLMSVKISRCL